MSVGRRFQAAPVANATSLVDLLRSRAANEPDAPLYTFLHYDADDAPAAEIRVGDLDRRARALAAVLQMHAKAGERALILAAPGAAYIVSVFACLYARLIAVPACLGPSERLLQRVRSVLQDCTPEIVLADAAGLGCRDAVCRGLEERLRATRWIHADQETPGVEHLWKESAPRHGDVAYLQYTSGSTGSPRGVVISHENVLSNLASLHEAGCVGREDRLVTWLPPYHDMGLVGNLFIALYSGFDAAVMSPMAFVRQPMRWLREVSERRATYIGGPNFGYELCTQRITAAERDQLDLSSVDIALCAAEPIRADTLERFAAHFGSCGFRREAFYTGYGLAEATLMVTGTPHGEPRVLRVSRKGLAYGVVEDPVAASDVVELVSSGSASPEYEIHIVQPETRRLCAPHLVGEIWVRGDAVARGYWNEREEPEQTFRAALAEADAELGSARFLRTGDLGFLRDGELYVCGRIKDMLILHGANLYPQDIEASIERCHPALRSGCGAAFSLEIDGEERLAIVYEVRDTCDLEEVVRQIRRGVQQEHGVAAHAVALIRPGALPKSTSGKIARQPTKRAFLDGSLPVLLQWQATRRSARGEATTAPGEARI